MFAGYRADLLIVVRRCVQRSVLHQVLHFISYIIQRYADRSRQRIEVETFFRQIVNSDLFDVLHDLSSIRLETAIVCSTIVVSSICA